MIDTPAFDDVPEFAHDGTKVKPGTSKYTGGFVAGEMLPFDYHNWLMNGLTKNGVAGNGAAASIHAELKAILTAHGVTPNSELSNQLAGVLGRYVYGDDERASIAITDADTPLKSGFYILDDPYTHGPTGVPYYIIQIQRPGIDTFAMQIAIGIASTITTFVRNKISGTWGAWKKIWNADNDGAGSGLDADTVCGIDPVDGTAGTAGQVDIPAGTSWVIPKGTYVIVAAPGNSGYELYLELWQDTCWRANMQSNFTGLIISDGINYRITNTTPYASFASYRKLA
jgi:hypothetical protein